METEFNRSKTGVKPIFDLTSSTHRVYRALCEDVVPIVVEPVKVEPKMKQMAFAASAESQSAASYKLSWQSAKGRTYDVYSCSDLLEGWGPTPIATVEGTGDAVEYVPQEAKPSMFFKVSVRLSDNY